ncbi:MAG: diguanylate cyclase [Granulosicoccus sp.]
MTPAIRISLGIVAMTASMIFAADWILGIFPDPNVSALEERQDLSEALGMQFSGLIIENKVAEIRLAMDEVVKHTPDLMSVGLNKASGEVVAATGNHTTLWDESKATRSTPQQVMIPMFQGQTQWAVLQLKFSALPYSGFLGLLATPLYKLVAVIVGFGFLVYLLYLSRTLRYLDPSAAIPSRVRAALDQLVEGVIILDHNQKIVLANAAFASQMEVAPEDLLGVDPGSLPWVLNDSEGSTALPWEAAIRFGSRITDERLELQSPNLGIRVLTANISPITDGGGKQRGVLASFNDISELETTNKGLRDTLKNLETAHAAVRNKNEELYRLATIDPLTECFNRRAFFEKLETEFELASREELKLSVIMADIDHFKKINDSYGHATGDIVIKDMARVLVESVGPNDYVGRYGGEEFCVVLVGADENAAIERSNLARIKFENLYVSSDSATKGRIVTASFGVSCIGFGAKDVSDLLNQADQALYDSKKRSRNCVTSWVTINNTIRKAS